MSDFSRAFFVIAGIVPHIGMRVKLDNCYISKIFSRKLDRAEAHRMFTAQKNRKFPPPYHLFDNPGNFPYHFLRLLIRQIVKMAFNDFYLAANSFQEK